MGAGKIDKNQKKKRQGQKSEKRNDNSEGKPI